MAKLEQITRNEINKLNKQIDACKKGQEGLKNEYIAARQSYNHILIELRCADSSEKAKYGYDIPEDNVRTNGYIELLEAQIEKERKGGIDILSPLALEYALTMYRNYLDKKEG